MIVESGFNESIVLISVILGFLFVIFSIIGIMATHSYYKKKRLIFALFIIVGVIMIIGPWLNLTEIHKDNIGIDEQGIWYGEGVHFKKITEVPLKGTIQIDYNKNLAYNLTKEEVVSLERGSSFPERLREDITIRYEKWNVILEDIPEGIDHNHVQLIIISS